VLVRLCNRATGSIWIVRRCTRADPLRWGQIYILDSLLSFVPQSHMDAEQLAERISVRLQHANSAVVLTTIKVVLYLMNYMEDESLIRMLERKMGPPLGQCILPFLVAFDSCACACAERWS
jgi:vesicle coat complex subunit